MVLMVLAGAKEGRRHPANPARACMAAFVSNTALLKRHTGSGGVPTASFLTPHPLTLVQTRSEVGLGAWLWYCAVVHSVNCVRVSGQEAWEVRWLQAWEAKGKAERKAERLCSHDIVQTAMQVAQVRQT